MPQKKKASLEKYDELSEADEELFHHEVKKKKSRKDYKAFAAQANSSYRESFQADKKRFSKGFDENLQQFN